MDPEPETTDPELPVTGTQTFEEVLDAKICEQAGHDYSLKRKPIFGKRSDKQ